MGVLYILKRDYKKAKELLEFAREKKPEDYKTIYALIYACVNLKEYNEAENLIKEILFLDITEDIKTDVEQLLIRIQAKMI